jgi:hypothetical protein
MKTKDTTAAEAAKFNKVANMLVGLIEADLRACDLNHKKFVEEFQANPARAMEWSRDTFASAAKQTVLAQALSVIRHHLTIEESAESALDAVLAVATKNAMRATLYPARSTSVQSNEMHVAKGQAWAELAERVDSLVEEVA